MNTVLFVCVENACRSQMAEKIANYFGKGVLKAYSAGSQASGKVNPNAIEVMKEIGIDISKAKSKSFDSLPTKKFNYVITLGCKDVCPFVPAQSHINWQIADPKDKSIEFFREVRDDIKKEVDCLIQELSIQKKQEGEA
ncbi:arsenate reductase ArsC [Patescibacteria group bacterium]|nr:arsenate reductase ArsC [Patescibacteria group bacterium]